MAFSVVKRSMFLSTRQSGPSLPGLFTVTHVTAFYAKGGEVLYRSRRCVFELILRQNKVGTWSFRCLTILYNGYSTNWARLHFCLMFIQYDMH